MRPEKQLLLDELNEYIDQANAIIVTQYSKLSPKVSWSFGEELSKVNSSFKVVKKRIFSKAAEKKDLPFKNQKFDGHVGVVFIGGDLLETTKMVVKFRNDNEGLLEIITGQIEGKVASAQDIVELSKLPTKDVMRAELLGLLEAPMSSTLAVMNSLLTSVPLCMGNKNKDLS